MNNPQNNALGVFCGAKLGTSKDMKLQVEALLNLFARAGWDLVYGGSSKGFMGVAAKTFKKENRAVIGVIPYGNTKAEPEYDQLNQKLYTDNLFDRKRKMLELADAFLVLPGGVGTLDEIFEVIANNNIGFIKKTIAIFNYQGFYDDLFNQFKKMIDFGFLKHNIWEKIIIEENPELLFNKLTD